MVLKPSLCIRNASRRYIIKNQFQTRFYLLIFICQQHHIQAMRSESLWDYCISVKQHLQKGNADMVKCSLFMFYIFKLTCKTASLDKHITVH